MKKKKGGGENCLLIFCLQANEDPPCLTGIVFFFPSFLLKILWSAYGNPASYIPSGFKMTCSKVFLTEKLLKCNIHLNTQGISEVFKRITSEQSLQGSNYCPLRLNEGNYEDYFHFHQLGVPDAHGPSRPVKRACPLSWPEGQSEALRGCASSLRK